MDGSKTSFLLGWPIFRGELLVPGSVGFKELRLVERLQKIHTMLYPSLPMGFSGKKVIPAQTLETGNCSIED